MYVYRIQKDKYRDTILTGEGARLFGGRWNAAGHPLIYTSSSMELALLEMTVHFDGTPPSDLPPYILITIEIPDAGIVFLEAENLPLNWMSYADYPAEELDGYIQETFRQTGALAVAVPSVIIPQSESRNMLINPLHPNISDVKVLAINPYSIDPRLV